MDRSGRDLQQLCLSAKSNVKINSMIREWIEDADMDAQVGLGMLGEDFESDRRIALNCLLNSYHATEGFVEKFLQQHIYDGEGLMKKEGKIQKDCSPILDAELPSFCCQKEMTSPFFLHFQDMKGITALHVAVYRNSLHVDKIARLLLSWDSSSNEFLTSDEDAQEVSLASIPMICGSYPLHILTGQNLTIKEELLETLLCADSSIPFKDDVNGDNPISLLWKNTLRFRWAISVMEGATTIDYIKTDDCSWMAVITPHQFIRFSLRMAGVALQKRSGNQSTSRNTLNTIHDICRIPRCPPMLLRLLRSPEYNTSFSVSGSAYAFDEDGMLPIHHAVQSPPVTYRFVPSTLKSQHKKSLVETLLEENPGGVRIADSKGRLPLHYALDKGCISEKDLMTLIQLYPDSLRIEDPETGLLPFMLVSTDLGTSHHYEKSSSAENYQAEWKKEHVGMTYLLLMLCPDAILFKTSVRIAPPQEERRFSTDNAKLVVV